jgi:hypothetical protein
MTSCKIAVIFPSRGLCFSQTAEELLDNLEGYDYDLFFAHGLPIPDCFEKPVREALRGSYTHVWLVEDDMILPEGTLDAMLLMDAPVVACDYPVSKSGQGAIMKSAEGKIVFAGTGCLLVKRAVFDALTPPYFRTDIRWNAANYGSFIRLTAARITNPDLEGYGLHDTNFGLKLWQAGIPISEAGVIGQRKLVKLGVAGSNHGAHEIEEWTKVKPNVLYRKFKRMPALPLGKLVPVMTAEGELMVHPDHAKKLIKAGVATKPPKQSIAVDYNELHI